MGRQWSWELDVVRVIAMTIKGSILGHKLTGQHSNKRQVPLRGKVVLFCCLFVGWKPFRPVPTIAGLRDVG